MRAVAVGIVLAAGCARMPEPGVQVPRSDHPSLLPDDMPIDPYAPAEPVAGGDAAAASVDLTELTLRGQLVYAIAADTDLGDPRVIERLELTVRLPRYRLPTTGNQVVVADDLRTQRVTIAQGPGAEASAADRKAALRATTAIDAGHELVRDIATSVVDGITDRSAQVAALVGWIDTHIAYEFDNQVVASTVLVNGRGDCSEQALLFVALARAAGIPARQVTGFAFSYADGGRPVFGYHAWAEVAIDGRWVQVDPTWNEPVADATHLVVYEGDDPPFGLDLDDLELAVTDVTRGPQGEDDPIALARALPVHLALRR